MKGICFIEPMFHAVAAGAKIQTRRIKKSDTPRYEVGEILYLKEPYINTECETLYYFDSPQFGKKGWKNKLFMPEKYARYFIRITNIKAERLQDITTEDCLKEGIEYNRYNDPYYFNPLSEGGEDTAQEAYEALIDKINGKGTWESNPFVWVYDFELVKN